MWAFSKRPSDLVSCSFQRICSVREAAMRAKSRIFHGYVSRITTCSASPSSARS